MDKKVLSILFLLAIHHLFTEHLSCVYMCVQQTIHYHIVVHNANIHIHKGTMLKDYVEAL